MKSIRSVLTIFILFLYTQVSGSFFNGANLTYKHLSGNCAGANYKINLDLFVDLDSLRSPDSTLIFFGDGQFGYAAKIDSLFFCGSLYKYKYSIEHSYPGCSTYNIGYIDSSSIKRAINHPNSQNKVYEVVATLILSPFWGNNLFSPSPLNNLNSVRTLKNQEFRYNLNYIDPEGDSLHFELVSFAFNISSDYWIPPDMSINAKSGELIWLNPDSVGIYDFYIKVTEYRYGFSIGQIISNISIFVDSGIPNNFFNYTTNWDTDVLGYFEYHLLPGENLQLFFEFDSPLSDLVAINTFSELYFIPNFATFTELSSAGNSKFGLFDWTPLVNDSRNTPYVLTFSGNYYFNSECYINTRSVLVYVDNVNNIIEENVNYTLYIFPNPSNGEFTIKSEKLIEEISIYDISGKLIYVQSLNTKQSSIQLSLGSGMYFVKVKTETGIVTKKIISY